MEQALPAVEGADRDPVGFTDPLDWPEADGVLRQDTQDKEKTVPAIGNDGIRKDGVCCGASALQADEAADAEVFFYRPVT